MSSINYLLKGKEMKQPIQWTPEADSAFDNIENALVPAPISTSPGFDKQLTIRVTLLM